MTSGSQQVVAATIVLQPADPIGGGPFGFLPLVAALGDGLLAGAIGPQRPVYWRQCR